MLSRIDPDNIQVRLLSEKMTSFPKNIVFGFKWVVRCLGYLVFGNPSILLYVTVVKRVSVPSHCKALPTWKRSARDFPFLLTPRGLFCDKGIMMFRNQIIIIRITEDDR